MRHRARPRQGRRPGSGRCEGTLGEASPRRGGGHVRKAGDAALLARP